MHEGTVFVKHNSQEALLRSAALNVNMALFYRGRQEHRKEGSGAAVIIKIALMITEQFPTPIKTHRQVLLKHDI